MQTISLKIISACILSLHYLINLGLQCMRKGLPVWYGNYMFRAHPFMYAQQETAFIKNCGESHPSMNFVWWNLGIFVNKQYSRNNSNRSYEHNKVLTCKSVELAEHSVCPSPEEITLAMGLWVVKTEPEWMRGGLCPKVEPTMPGGRPISCWCICSATGVGG